MLDDTLVVWGAGFGRTCFAQGELTDERLTYRYQRRDFRLTDVHGRVVRELLA